MLLPFTCALLDLVCGESDECPIETVFADYVDIVNEVCGRNGRMKWTFADILALHRDIQQMKLNGVRVLEAYQKSGMGTVKWHMLDHASDEKLRNGGLILCDAGGHTNILIQS